MSFIPRFPARSCIFTAIILKCVMQQKKIIRAAYAAFSFLILAFSASQCFAQSESADGSLSAFQYMRKLNSVFEFVQQNYVDEVDPKVLYEGAMKGLMGSLKDPYTAYLEPDTIRDLADTTKGNFGGVGLQISKPFESTAEKPAYVEVSSPIEDTPGAKAGILAGDLITAIDGDATPEMTMQQVLAHLRGDVGKPVTISIKRGKNLTFDVTLIRALIEVPTVKYAMIDSTAYLKIIEFTPDTPARVQDAIDSFKKSGFKNMIIDLRNNPGGLITSAVGVADKFIDYGPIVTTKSRIQAQDNSYFATKAATEIRNIPIIVLINKGSASASEILAGALKDNHLAYLVGQGSYGKGSVQQVIPLNTKGDEEIKMTMARYYTPSDTNIDKVGIPPDREVLYPELTEAEEKTYADLVKADVIAKYADAHPNMSEADIAKYAKELKKTYNLQETLLRRLVRIQVWRKQPSRLYDLDYDIQLNAALKILKEERNFRSLVAATKTLKELQKEAELAAAAEKKK